MNQRGSQQVFNSPQRQRSGNPVQIDIPTMRIPRTIVQTIFWNGSSQKTIRIQRNMIDTSSNQILTNKISKFQRQQ